MKFSFTHKSFRVESTWDGRHGYDYTCIIAGVLAAKGWVRGDAIEVHDAILGLLDAV